MAQIKILDCTLRDGGYIVGAQFGDEVIAAMIQGLVDAQVDVIECGFLQDQHYTTGSTIFNCTAQVRPFLPADRAGKSFVLLADYSRYQIEQLEPYDGRSIDGIRACFFKHEFMDDRAGLVAFFRQIQAQGYNLSIQPVDAQSYSEAEWCALMDCINPLAPHTFSIVDTFGSMYKEDLQRIFEQTQQILSPSIQLGFHSHNNLQMSFALSLDLISLCQHHQRDVIIDATIFGMGRGAGNTNIELLMHYLNRRYHRHYDIEGLCALYDRFVAPLQLGRDWGYSMAHFLAGAYATHSNNIAYLLQKDLINATAIHQILSEISPEMRKRYHYDALEQAYIRHQHKIDA